MRACFPLLLLAALAECVSSDNEAADPRPRRVTDGGNVPGSPDAAMPQDGGSVQDDAGGSAGGSPDGGCTGSAPATVLLARPGSGSGSWLAGDLTGLPHPSTTGPCSTCHLSCKAGEENTIVGYDHSNPNYVCNYCHDPSTKVVATNVRTGSMANYRSSSDSQVCTCCHNGTNNGANGVPAAPATPIVPSTTCTETSAWPLVYPTYDSSKQAFSGGQFFKGN
jgi:hypothetical protein